MIDSFTRRGVLLTPLVPLAATEYAYRVDRQFPAQPAIDIEVEAPSRLNAECQMKTMNGRTYSAYDTTPLPAAAETQVTERGMRRIVTRNRFAGGRAGSGGVEIRVEGLNGDIRIAQRKA